MPRKEKATIPCSLSRKKLINSVIDQFTEALSALPALNTGTVAAGM